MALIENSFATEQLNVSSNNLDAILSINKPAKTEDVTTGVALSCLDEIKKTQLGWGHSIKKFFATAGTYALVMAFPIGILAGTLWIYSERIKNIFMLYEAKNLALAGTGLGTLCLTDFLIGKYFGIRPITALLIGIFDVYRQGAKFLSKQVRDSYTCDEEKWRKEIEANREMIKKQLGAAYLGIAVELAKRHTEGKLDNEIPMLDNNLPIIAKALSEIGLSKPETIEILSPLEETMKLIKKSA